MRKLLLALTPFAFGTDAYAQSQASLDALAQMVMSSQQQQVPGGECVAGPCTTQGLIPITFQPGDVTVAGGGSVSDSTGNTWTLQTGVSCQGNAPNNWWAGLAENGQQLWCGYGVALRLVNGDVWYEEAKGSGWRDLTAAAANGILMNGLGGPYVVNPGQGSGGAQAAVSAAPPSAPAVSVPAVSAPAVSVPNISPDPSAGVSGCPAANAVTPGNGSFTSGSNLYSIDANNGDVASANGAPINSGAYQTSHLAQGSDGVIYGQDENSLQWFALMGSGTDTWWQPLASVPAAIMSAGLSLATVANSTGANPCSSGDPQTASGQQNRASGVLSDILQVCSNPATIANPKNADLCSKAVANQAMLDQISAQLAAAQQAAGTK